MLDRSLIAEEEEILSLMMERRFLVGAPRNEKDLRVQYPEMYDHPEFSRTRLKNADDLLFVWWYRASTSPYYDMPDEKKLERCINRAYRSEARRAAKLEEFRGGRFPDELKAAFKRMESINAEARIENYARLLMVRANCHKMLNADVSTMSEEDKDSWTKRAPALWKMLQDTQRDIERGAYGVADAEDTLADVDDSALRDFRNEQ